MTPPARCPFSRTMRPARFIGLVLAAVFASTLCAEEEPIPPVRPTVTVRSGDTGGLFFGRKTDPGKTRHYYLAAEPVQWDYAPTGRDEVCGLTLPPSLVSNRTRPKLRYIQYTDATFTTRVIPNASLGIMGPTLRGVVGEFLEVTLLNRTAQPVSMHPHGVHYDKDSEGAYYRPGPGRGAALEPGARFTYVWELDEKSGPLPTEPSSKAWLYHSHVFGDAEVNLGLVGCIIVTDPKRARADGTPADVDREFATLFMIFDESGLDPLGVPVPAGRQPAAAPANLSYAETLQKTEEGERYAINGYVFGNLPGLQMNQGDRVRWYLFGLGSEQDFHTAHWHGLRVIDEAHRRTDVVELLPASMKIADFVADNPGTWLFQCHVAEHMREGMFTKLTVYSRDVVGASRAAQDAFLGLTSATQSIRIDGTRTALDLTSKPARANFLVEGTISAPDNLALLGQTMRVQLGDRSVRFRLDGQGLAEDGHARVHVFNGDDAGVIRGGSLRFELAFNGADWIAPASTARTLPLTIEFAQARYTATVSIGSDK